MTPSMDSCIVAKCQARFQKMVRRVLRNALDEKKLHGCSRKILSTSFFNTIGDRYSHVTTIFGSSEALGRTLKLATNRQPHL